MSSGLILGVGVAAAVLAVAAPRTGVVKARGRVAALAVSSRPLAGERGGGARGPKPNPVAVGWAIGAIVLAIAMLVGLIPAAVVVLTVAIGRRRRAWGKARTAAAEPWRTLPEAVALAAGAVAAGATVAGAVEALAQWAPEPHRRASAEAVRRWSAGTSLAEALAVVPEVAGDAVRPLVAVLSAGLDDGLALLPALDALALDARRERRRRAEVAARRLSVQLALPLVGCTLPSFVLLGVVPLLLAGAQGLSR